MVNAGAGVLMNIPLGPTHFSRYYLIFVEQTYSLSRAIAMRQRLRIMKPDKCEWGGGSTLLVSDFLELFTLVIYLSHL